MISIILNLYDPTFWQRQMSMACLAGIRKFTDPPYEIIVVDNEPKFPIRDEYKVLEPYVYIKNAVNKTCYESYNQGAEVAKYDNLVFMQNDVFVHERTINKLVEYLKDYDVAYPQQLPLPREQVKLIYDKPEEVNFGWRDAGMLAITKEAFQKTGGWDGRYKNLLGDKAFYERIADAGLNETCMTNAIITHIMGANNWSKDKQLYETEMSYDANLKGE
jgi:GT2 family glycosyltransferase